MRFVKYIILICIGFSSGIIISGAVFAFISTLGLIQRFAKKTSTERFANVYEEAIIFGGIFGTSTSIFNYYLPIGNLFVGILSFCTGIFYGCLAMSLAEVLNVIPILTRRGKVESGLRFFIFALAFGKLVGSLLYFCISGFYYF